MGPVGNPLLWGMGGGSHSAADAAHEMAGTYTDHIPAVMAGVLVVSGVALFLLNRAGFRFAVEASAGRG